VVFEPPFLSLRFYRSSFLPSAIGQSHLNYQTRLSLKDPSPFPLLRIGKGEKTFFCGSLIA
jgi:hypothetical protein